MRLVPLSYCVVGGPSIAFLSEGQFEPWRLSTCLAFQSASTAIVYTRVLGLLSER